MKTVYDPDVIQQFADNLYTKAKSIIQSYTLMGVIPFGFAGFIMGGPVFGVIGAVTGGIIGYSIGKEKALAHKLQAQTALCQVQIEKNSRQIR